MGVGVIMKPIIGLTSFYKDSSDPKYHCITINNTKAILKAGGIPVIIPIMEPEHIKSFLKRIDGIVFTGGGDINPIILGENPIKELKGISPERDLFEIELFKQAKSIDMPMLGICRGAQLINAAAGGENYQDIYTQFNGALGHSPGNIPGDALFHSVCIENSSKLHNVFKTSQIYVNSFHHQAVKEPAEGFRISARSTEGLIECIESINNRFIVGVQWHPENLVDKHPLHLELFREFIKEAEKNI
jgi:putative glutamine amidotransferase